MFFKGHLAGGAGPAGAGKDPGRDFLGLRFTDILHLWLSGQQQPADWPTLAGWIFVRGVPALIRGDIHHTALAGEPGGG